MGFDEIWSNKKNKYVKTPDHLIRFFNEIDEVCKKYYLSISHEDRGGGFEIELYNEGNIAWLKHASKNY